MAKTRGLSRRSFLARVAGAGTAVGAAGLAGCATTGVTDADTGAYADPVGGGRGAYGRRYSGGRSCTDSDAGTYADAVGQGRTCYSTGITDKKRKPVFAKCVQQTGTQCFR